MKTNLNNVGATIAKTEKNLSHLSVYELTEMVKGDVETSCFDGMPVFNCSQRWELWYRGFLTEYDFRHEESRFNDHQVLKPYQVEKIEFQKTVVGMPF